VRRVGNRIELEYDQERKVIGCPTKPFAKQTVYDGSSWSSDRRYNGGTVRESKTAAATLDRTIADQRVQEATRSRPSIDLHAFEAWTIG
jgi:hypothetical protein